MPINFNEYGFVWPNATTITNYSGSQMSITPEFVRSGYQTDMNDRSKECFRIYTTPLGLMSELEIKHWQAGQEFEMELIKAFHEIFKESGESEILLSAVLERLENRGFEIIQIHIVVGWLIKGQFVNFDPEKMMVGDIKDKRGKTQLS